MASTCYGHHAVYTILPRHQRQEVQVAQASEAAWSWLSQNMVGEIHHSVDVYHEQVVFAVHLISGALQ